MGVLILAGLIAQSDYTGHGEPTAAEQHVLELINRARANPEAEGARLGAFTYPLPGGDIREGLTPGEAADVGPRPPLAMNGVLIGVARAHSRDMWTRAYFSHQNPDGLWPWDRASRAGYPWQRFGENIAATSEGSAAFLEDLLMVDPNFAGRGHRKNLLDIHDPAEVPFREIGIGFFPASAPVSTPHGGLKDFLTQNFARRGGDPFVLGAVYHDASLNGFYDIGEGVAGVRIRLSPANGWSARSGQAGGYAFPASLTGTVTVHATGGGFGSAQVEKTVTLGGENVKVDFLLSDAPDSDGDGLPDGWEQDRFGNLQSVPGADPDGDGYTNLAELQADTNPSDAASIPGTAIGGAVDVPPAPMENPEPEGGSCGLFGAELLLLLALLRRLA